MDPKHELFRRFPVLYLSEIDGDVDLDFGDEDGQRKTLSVVVACGQYRLSAVESDSSDEPDEFNEDNEQSTVAEPTVLSKKETRKRKKQLKRKRPWAFFCWRGLTISTRVLQYPNDSMKEEGS